MDQLGKIRRHYWKERLNISNNAKYESDTSQAIEDIASQSCENLRRLYGGGRGGGQVCTLYHTNVYKLSFATLRGYIFVSFQQNTFKLGYLTNLKGAMFSGVDGFSISCPRQKLKKKP